MIIPYAILIFLTIVTLFVVWEYSFLINKIENKALYVQHIVLAIILVGIIFKWCELMKPIVATDFDFNNPFTFITLALSLFLIVFIIHIRSDYINIKKQ